jgi:MinD superfamily P-loop ATPase
MCIRDRNISEYIGGVNYFYHDNKCNGCGICEKVCLSKKIKIVEKKPIWQRNVLCYMCFACLNYCPKKSVQVKNIPGVRSYTTENSRYPHPYAAVNDISAQKESI